MMETLIMEMVVANNVKYNRIGAVIRNLRCITVYANNLNKTESI